jgi:acyl-CoA synthetase (AMP-forming)/AMP-acid ligase II/pimeloyl-ACP methyl ester carboxylesterase
MASEPILSRDQPATPAGPPGDSHFLSLAGLRYHYIDAGQGDAVVMLHGNPTWSYYYRNVVRSLRDDYRCIVPDHIGCGLSDKPDDSRYDYTLSRRVDDLEALLDHLNLTTNLTLILHDWGGMIGMAYASRHPERVKRLVILNTAAFLLPAGKRLPWSLWACRNTPLGPWLVRGLNLFSRIAARWAATRRPLTDDVRAAYLAPYDSWHNRIAVLRFVQDIPLKPGDRSYALVHEVQEGLPRFQDVPVLICWGDRDFVFDHHFLAEWQRRLPLAEVHRFVDAGHYVLEDAGDEIIPLIRSFLQTNPLGPGNGEKGVGNRERSQSPPANGVHSPFPRPARLGGPGREVVNIASHLPAQAARRPQTLAIVHPRGERYRHYTFQELNGESNALARGFQRVGIRRGMRTVLMVTPSLEFFALTFALFKLGAVIVLIDPGMGTKNLGICLAEAEPEAFIGIPKAHLARVLFRWGRATIRHCVTVGRRFGWSGATLDQVRRLGMEGGTDEVLADTRADELAAILFTSGSTGVAKGVMYTHGIFAAQVELLRRQYDIQPGEVDLPTFPLFGLFAPALGMTAIIPEMDATRPADVEPRKILDAIMRFGVTNLFGSPALIQRVSRHGAAHRIKLPTLRRVISAGAPVPARAIARFASMLPEGVQVFTPYGATEALPVASIGSDEILRDTARRTEEGAGVCVGRPVGGIDVKIIRISDEPIASWSDTLELPAGAIGEIVVQGPVVTRSYYNRPDSTRLAKIADPDRGTFWHRMGDLGYRDDDGRIWFCGRKSHRVVTPQITLFTIPCEGVFNAHPAVLRTALVGVVRDGATQPVLCVERDRETAPRTEEDLRRDLLALGAKYQYTQGITTILFHPGFPVDIRHNAKIFREKLAEWAAGRLP